MTQEQINFISTLDATTLDAVKKLLVKREMELYNERWWTHDGIDNYIYVITYVDGRKFHDYQGKRTYKKYLNDADAIAIGRETKDLFPEYEELMRKETA